MMAELHVYNARYPADLESLSVLPLGRKRHAGRVVIADPGVSQERRTSWEREINRKLHACGCVEASAGLMIGIAAGLVYLIVRWVGGAAFSWTELGLCLLFVFAISLAGKMVGLSRAQSRYRALVRDIAQEWKARPPQSERLKGCG
jgi:hypothetical protein